MRHFYFNIFPVILLLNISVAVSASTRWVDVTDSYLENPSFTSSNYDEWTVTASASSVVARAGCMEMWSGFFTMEKTIEDVPDGHYRLRVQALYRTRDHYNAYLNYKAGTEDIRGFMFANDDEKAVASQYDFYFTEYPGYTCYNVDGVYYPNSMEAAEAAFNQDAYWNELEFDVTNGTMVIGLYNDESVTDNWFVFDNFTIEMAVEAADPSSSSVIINEIMAANVDVVMSPAYNFDGWIEIYNPTDEDVWLGGSYLAYDKTDLTKWQMPDDVGSVPANGYMTIWLGSNGIKTNQAPFKLDCEGGSIYISDENCTLLASVTYPEAKGRMSYCRTTDGGSTWNWTATPTPAASNNDSEYCSQQLDAPVVSPDGQLFSSAVAISVEIPDGATLRFTTDGTTPTLDNGETAISGDFTARTSTTYRFRLFQDGMLPSPVTTRSYLKQEYDFTLPIVIVSTNDDYLYDDEIGVYVRGTNGCTGNGQSEPANWNMDWDRPVNFQYILPEDNVMAINQDVDFAISGGWTRSNTPRAFKLKADRVYENLNAMDYQFFDVKPYIKNKTLQMRVGGNDSSCRILDAALQTIIQRSGIDIDVVSYQPTVHYLNGEYKGLINAREPNNKDFAYANWGLSKEELEVYEQSPDSGAYMMLGTSAVLEQLVDLSETASDDSSYEEIKSLLDIDEYINYMAAELYLGLWDWPDNNVKAYRKIDGGKYRFVMFDLDSAFGTDDRDYDENGNAIYRNTFRWIDGMQWHWYDYIYDEGASRYGEIKFCTFFLNILENDEFRRKFIDTFCVIGGSVFDEEKADAILTELGDRVRTTMSWEGLSPDSSLNSIRTNLVDRVDEMAQDMIDYERLQLTDVSPQDVVLSADADNAKIFINDTEVPYTEFDGKLFAPVTLKAVAPSGYTFAGWRKQDIETETLIAKGDDWTYYDQGSLDGYAWYEASYDDSSWESGASPLGYGKDAVVTTLDYGTDSSNKRSTYYFRKTVDITDTEDKEFELNYVIDDGFIIYVNGTEAARYGLSDGDITYSTLASTADDNPDSGSVTLDASLFVNGTNIIAVEVHNNTANSSDILWNAELLMTGDTNVSSDYYSTSAEIDMPEDSSLILQACFDPLSDEEKLAAGMTPIMINEVSGANSIYVNDYFKRNDWVELYNTTDEEIDIAGMYLSNDTSDPYKYQISNDGTDVSTVVEAYGHIVIWCDKEDVVSMLHAPFKISADGGTLIVSAADKSWSNSLTFPAHEGDQTVGRYPDGATSIYLMNIPTIEKTNIYTSYLTELTDDSTPIEKTSVDNVENAVKISYAGGNLYIASDVARQASLTIYTVSGQVITNKQLSLYAGGNKEPVSYLPKGCYVARVAYDGGRTATCKFIMGI